MWEREQILLAEYSDHLMLQAMEKESNLAEDKQDYERGDSGM